MKYTLKMDRKELEKKRIEAIKEINRFYEGEKEKLKNRNVKLESFSFDIITDLKLTKNGIRTCKRKAIFLFQLNKYFDVKLKRGVKSL